MPGAWEIQQHNSVLCAVLSVESTSMAWALGLKDLIIPGPRPVTLSGMPYDMARNQACMMALESGAQWLFFLDSDVIPPANAVLRLIAHNKPVMSGLYCRRSPPWSIPVMMKNGQWVVEFPPGAVVEVDVVGAGCLLIHRTVLEQLKPSRPGSHWFDWRVNLRGAGQFPDGECMSEDFVFCLEVRRQLGVSILVDTSIQCKHAGLGEAGYKTYKPLDMAPVAA